MLSPAGLVLVIVAVILYGLWRLSDELIVLPRMRADELDGAVLQEPTEEEERVPGAFLHRILTDGFVYERDPWAREMAARVADRLQAGRPAEERFVVEVLWAQDFGAFTTPGRWVYLSRRLMERCVHEDAVAMVVAHEIAHHDMGHMDVSSPLAWLAGQKLHGPEWEAQADAHGFNLCLAAGYDPYRCLHLFDVIEEYALDVGDRDIVFGPERVFDREMEGEAAWKVEMLRWLHARRRGYAPLRERKAVLARAYEEALAAAR